MSLRHYVVALAVTMVLAACAAPAPETGNNRTPEPQATAGTGQGGNGDDGAGGGGGGDACRFLTPQEVGAAFGVDVADTEEAAADTCSYNDADGNVILIYSYIAQGGRPIFEDQRENFEGATEIDGIADGVLYFPGGGMYVLKGDALLNITAITVPQAGDDTELQAALEDIARAAAARM